MRGDALWAVEALQPLEVAVDGRTGGDDGPRLHPSEMRTGPTNAGTKMGCYYHATKIGSQEPLKFHPAKSNKGGDIPQPGHRVSRRSWAECSAKATTQESYLGSSWSDNPRNRNGEQTAAASHAPASSSFTPPCPPPLPLRLARTTTKMREPGLSGPPTSAWSGEALGWRPGGVICNSHLCSELS